MRTSVILADHDLVRLADSDDPKIRTAAEAAAARLAAPARWPDVPAHVAALIADVLAEARKEGRLIYRGVPISHCRYCDSRSTWKTKSPRHKREYEAVLSGIDFADRPLIISRHISVGGCRDCVDQALPVLRDELAGFPVQLPTTLRKNGAPTFVRWDRCRCKKCDWTGHQGQLGRLPTLMRDGTYPGVCPSCGAEWRPLGPNPFENVDGFDVVAESNQ